MQTQNRFFDDLARVAGGAVGALGGVKGELESLFRQQFERILRDMDLVGRDEFEAVRAMAQQARMEQEMLAAQVAASHSGRGVSAASKTSLPKVPPRAAAARLRRAARKKRAAK